MRGGIPIQIRHTLSWTYNLPSPPLCQGVPKRWDLATQYIRTRTLEEVLLMVKTRQVRKGASIVFIYLQHHGSITHGCCLHVGLGICQSSTTGGLQNWAEEEGRGQCTGVSACMYSTTCM